MTRKMNYDERAVLLAVVEFVVSGVGGGLLLGILLEALGKLWIP